MQEQTQPIGMPVPSAKTVLMDRVMTPAIWLTIGLAVGYTLSKSKKARI